MNAQGKFIFDADSHWSEPGDLFTRSAPAAYRDRLPKVVQQDGRPVWIFDGTVIGPHSAAGVVNRSGKKENPYKAMFEWPFEEIHPGAYIPSARLKVLDECGIDAQVIYPSTMGLGGQNLGKIGDRAISLVAVQVYNDRQAEVQAETKNRLLPLPLTPAWDVAASTAEARRVADLGLRGMNILSDPSEIGGPDLADRAWDPFWEVCADRQLPVHFHIGASVNTYFGVFPWKSHSNDTKLAIGGTMQFIGNSQVLVNLLVSGIFDRHPDLKVVSVESGIGWIPFTLEAIEYEMAENAPSDWARLKKKPLEAFRSNMYSTFWFEKNMNQLSVLVEAVGEDNILFETDFPHPTCLYPHPLDTVADKIAMLSPQAQAKILGENGRKLYRL